jgi:hypothetical protein
VLSFWLKCLPSHWLSGDGVNPRPSGLPICIILRFFSVVVCQVLVVHSDSYDSATLLEILHLTLCQTPWKMSTELEYCPTICRATHGSDVEMLNTYTEVATLLLRQSVYELINSTVNSETQCVISCSLVGTVGSVRFLFYLEDSDCVPSKCWCLVSNYPPAHPRKLILIVTAMRT